MRYLIIGGTSIFAEGLVDRLLEKQDTESIIATKLPGKKQFDKKLLEWRDLDIRNVEEANRIVQDSSPDIIFDLATKDSVGHAWLNPTETVDINVVGTINLLNAVRDFSPNARLVIGGSGEEYGRMKFSDLPVKENAKPQPVNIYGATKACQTMFARLYGQAFGLDIILLRTFYETSDKQDDRFAVSSFCKQFAEIEAGIREPVLYTGNLNNVRDFTDVADLVRAFDLVAEKGKKGAVYNAARGKATSLLDVITILERLTGIFVEIKMVANRVRPMDAPVAIADVSKIYEDTGWKAEIPIEKTIAGMLSFWRKNI